MRSQRSARPFASVVLMVVIALLGAACAPSSDSGTTTTAVPTTTTTTVASPVATPPTVTTTIAPRPVGLLPMFDDDAEVITDDFEVTIGILSNGLTYYIRANDRPGARAELRLAVRAGSVQEAEDQHGVAHYLEHMLFNGTEKFPANELLDVLQSFGSEFGPDINAYTSYEETVYELNLPIDRPGLLESGLDVLREWASAATIDPAEVDLERGVLLEEWRLRSQSYSGRYFEGVVASLLADTPYEGQSPLADGPTLDVTTPRTLRRFYDDWYRPDNMAVIAVGDFRVSEVEQMVIEMFGDLESRRGPQPPLVTTVVATEPQFFILADPEFRQSFVEFNYPLPELPAGTVGTTRQALALRLAWTMVVTRLSEDALRGDVPFYNASGAANPIVRTQRSPGLAAFADPDELAETTELLLNEIERAVIHGFSTAELERTIKGARSGVDLALEQSDTTQDATYADLYVENFLGREPIPPASADARLARRLLDEMTLDQVTETFRATIQATQPFIILVAPAEAAGDLPTEGDLAAIIDRVAKAAIPPRTDALIQIDTLLEPPGRADIDDIVNLSGTSIEVMTMENGATVVLLDTQIVEGSIAFGASSFGGWSLLDAADVTEAQLATAIVTSSGVAGFDQVSLERFLSDKIVFLQPYIDETEEGFFGQAATEDLETLFQLINLYMTEPRATEAGLGIALDQVRPFAEDPGSDPRLALSLALVETQFDDDRFLPIPPLEDLNTFDLDRSLEVYKERFADASDFVFVFLGDLDRGAAQDLAREYLGTLPSSNSREAYEDVRTPRPPAIAERVVNAGSGQLGEIAMLWDIQLTLDPVTRIEAELLDLVIRLRLTERIREELSATYSPFSVVSINDDPQNSLELFITISADPGDLDRIIDEVIADLTDLRTNGPTTEQMEIAREQLVRDLELFSNELLIDLITFYVQRPFEDSEQIFFRIDIALDATTGDLRDLARNLIALDDYIVVRLVPEDFGG